ncbi:MAG: exodeoxyribonuclease VII small subunit [Ruminococcus sp.]|jgi:exodeoxyribonuclease VII small subunit
MSKQEERQGEKQEVSLEEAFKTLDSIVERLESGELSLEESFQNYQKGMNILKECSGRIDLVEKKVLQMDEEGELHEF